MVKDLELGAEIIRSGGLVSFPTETVYGLGANALDPFAVARIFETKERPAFDPLIVHVADFQQIREIAHWEDPRLQLLADRFWPGPLTLILSKTDNVPDLVTSGLSTVGVRMPNHPVALELIRRSGCPIAAPSANKFGHLSPTRAEHVKRNLPEVNLVLDGGPTQYGLESTIVRLAEDGFQILRPGGITREDLLAVLPESKAQLKIGSPQAPGMMHSHYSPRKPLYLIDPGSDSKNDTATMGFIGFQKPSGRDYLKEILLAPTGDLREYASRLFNALHELENSDVTAIEAVRVPEIGLGIAIMDRLRKAAYSYQDKL
ncbi:L-threonylcarbamoyladenylate synthase [Robiginitalea sp.]|nr:L-threonylcarbamoyladenylate synthase [Robiginitalea sp.]